MKGVRQCFIEGSDKAAVTAKFMDGLAHLSNILTDERQFLTGDNPSIADFVLFEHIEHANRLTKDQEEKTYNRYPKLEEFHQRMANLPKLKAYLASDKYAAIPDTFLPSPPGKVIINPSPPPVEETKQPKPQPDTNLPVEETKQPKPQPDTNPAVEESKQPKPKPESD